MYFIVLRCQLPWSVAGGRKWLAYFPALAIGLDRQTRAYGDVTAHGKGTSCQANAMVVDDGGEELSEEKQPN